MTEIVMKFSINKSGRGTSFETNKETPRFFSITSKNFQILVEGKS